MSTTDKARAEAVGRWPLEWHSTSDEAWGRPPIYDDRRETFIAGAEWQASRRVEAAPSDTDLLTELRNIRAIWQERRYASSRTPVQAGDLVAKELSRVIETLSRTPQPVQVEATDEMTKPLEPSYTLDISRSILIETFAHKQIIVEGNPTAIDMLREFAIDHKETRSIRVYEHAEERRQVAGPDQLKRIESISYTRLKELRKE
jgi:hypothetical protein